MSYPPSLMGLGGMKYLGGVNTATGSSSPSAKSQSVGNYDVVSLDRLSPEQKALFQRLMEGSGAGVDQGLQNLSRLASGDPEQFAALEAPALRQFGQLQGGLASRFSGMGMGARRSSGFQNTTNAAAMDLAERLQGQRMNLQQSAIDQLLGLSKSLLGTDMYNQGFLPKSKPFWQELLLGLSGGIGQGIGALPGLMFT